MADEPIPPIHDPQRPDARAVAYLDGLLPEAERAEFEAHLKTCDDCRATVELCRVEFPLHDQVLAAAGKPRKPSDYLAMLEAAQAIVAAEKAKPDAAAPEARARDRERPRRPRGPRWLVAAAIAAGAVALAITLLSPGAIQPTPITAPHRDLAPLRPGPAPAPLQGVDASVFNGTLVLSALRPRDGRYVAAGLVDPSGGRWLIQRGDQPDPSCGVSCESLSLRVKLDPLPPGRLRALIWISSAPLDQASFEEWLPKATPQQPAEPGAGARAAGLVEVPR